VADLIWFACWLSLLAWMAYREWRPRGCCLADVRAMARERAYRGEAVPDWGQADIYPETHRRAS
jgi:hypothetical protein